MASPENCYKGNVYGMVLTMENVQRPSFKRLDNRYECYKQYLDYQALAQDGTLFSSPMFTSSSDRKWMANINRLKDDLSDYYTLEVVSSERGVTPDRKSILNNCFSHSVQETKEANFEVVFYLKEEMQTPRILINFGQRLASLRMEIRCTPKFPDKCFLAHQHMLSFIGNMLDSNELCDVLIQTNGTMIPAHKCIVAANSKKLHAMFMKEKNIDFIEIKNSNLQAVKEVLKYMYTQEDPVFVNAEMAIEVYKICHMYEVPNLFNFALAYLVANVNAVDVLHMLMCGADYSDPALMKDSVMCYLTENPKIELNSSKCRAVITMYPILFEFVLEYLGQKQ